MMMRSFFLVAWSAALASASLLPAYANFDTNALSATFHEIMAKAQERAMEHPVFGRALQEQEDMDMSPEMVMMVLDGCFSEANGLAPIHDMFGCLLVAAESEEGIDGNSDGMMEGCMAMSDHISVELTLALAPETMVSTGEGNVAGVLEVPLASIGNATSELTLANCSAVFGNPAMLCLTHWDTDAMVTLFTAFNNSFAGLSGCELFASAGDMGMAGGGGGGVVDGVEESAESVGQSGHILETFMDEAGQACTDIGYTIPEAPVAPYVNMSAPLEPYVASGGGACPGDAMMGAMRIPECMALMNAGSAPSDGFDVTSMCPCFGNVYFSEMDCSMDGNSPSMLTLNQMCSGDASDEPFVANGGVCPPSLMVGMMSIPECSALNSDGEEGGSGGEEDMASDSSVMCSCFGNVYFSKADCLFSPDNDQSVLDFHEMCAGGGAGGGPPPCAAGCTAEPADCEELRTMLASTGCAGSCTGETRVKIITDVSEDLGCSSDEQATMNEDAASAPSASVSSGLISGAARSAPLATLATAVAGAVFFLV